MDRPDINEYLTGSSSTYIKDGKIIKEYDVNIDEYLNDVDIALESLQNVCDHRLELLREHDKKLDFIMDELLFYIEFKDTCCPVTSNKCCGNCPHYKVDGNKLCREEWKRYFRSRL